MSPRPMPIQARSPGRRTGTLVPIAGRRQARHGHGAPPHGPSGRSALTRRGPAGRGWDQREEVTMPSSREILRRFRPVGAPGALSRRGVPADRVQERDAELQPVFALLADVEREAAAVRAAAAEDAAARESAARDAAAALRAEGRTRAAAERNAAAAERARLTEEAGAATVSAARARAAELAAR